MKKIYIRGAYFGAKGKTRLVDYNGNNLPQNVSGLYIDRESALIYTKNGYGHRESSFSVKGCVMEFEICGFVIKSLDSRLK